MWEVGEIQWPAALVVPYQGSGGTPVFYPAVQFGPILCNP
jgi:hypothetical protein